MPMDYDPYDPYDPNQPDDQDAEGKYAAFLSFDRCKYSEGRVPCQALAATFLFGGISFCVNDADGTTWLVSKKQVRQLLESGKYVWIVSRKIERLDFDGSKAFLIRCVSEQSKYFPVHRDIMSENEVARFLEVPRPFVQIKGRKRKYFLDGRVGPAMNIARKLRHEA